MPFTEKLNTPATFIISLALVLAANGFLLYHYGLSEPADTELEVGSFVGGAGPGAQALIAVVASGAEGGEVEREVTAYLCDGIETSEWFAGEAGNELDIASEAGARLEGILAPKSTIGTIALDNDTSIAFAASPAYGISGLYSVDVSADGSFSGTSETGGRIEGQIAREANPEGERAVTATITSPEGQRTDLDSDNVTAKNLSAGDARFIVSETRLVGFGTRDLDGELAITSSGCICTDSSGRCINCTEALSSEKT